MRVLDETSDPHQCARLYLEDGTRGVTLLQQCGITEYERTLITYQGKFLGLQRDVVNLITTEDDPIVIQPCVVWIKDDKTRNSKQQMTLDLYTITRVRLQYLMVNFKVTVPPFGSYLLHVIVLCLIKQSVIFPEKSYDVFEGHNTIVNLIGALESSRDKRFQVTQSGSHEDQKKLLVSAFMTDSADKICISEQSDYMYNFHFSTSASGSTRNALYRAEVYGTIQVQPIFTDAYSMEIVRHAQVTDQGKGNC